jgi:hypothetical protein
MTAPNDIAGTAALSICESLLLALNDHKILPDHTPRTGCGPRSEALRATSG